MREPRENKRLSRGSKSKKEKNQEKLLLSATDFNSGASNGSQLSVGTAFNPLLFCFRININVVLGTKKRSAMIFGRAIEPMKLLGNGQKKHL